MSALAETPRDRDWLIAIVALGCAVAASALLVWNPRPSESSVPDTAPVVGKVSFSSADLRRRADHRLGWSEVGTGAEVRELDALFVPPGVEARVSFVDGTVLELDERSLVVVDLPHAGRRSVSIRQGSVEGSAGIQGLALSTAHGTALLAPSSGAHLEIDGEKIALAVTRGEATVGATRLVNGDRAGLTGKGAVVAEPRWPVLLAEPGRNSRQVFRAVPLRVSFKWEGEIPAGARVQLARDRGFAFVLEEHDAADPAFTSKDPLVGVLWWRVVDENGKPVSESRRITALEDLPPSLLSPREGEVVLTDDKTLAVFSWAQVRGVARYQFEVSSTADFATFALQEPVEGGQLRAPLALAEGRWYWRVRIADENRLETSASVSRSFRLIHKPLPEAPELLNPEIEVEPAPKK